MCQICGNDHNENEQCIETCPVCGKVMRYRSPSNEWGMAVEPGYYECEDDYEHFLAHMSEDDLFDAD